ncbi:MAG: hypothetical protein ACUVQP_11265 [Bacteroidales bacterium]
MRETWNRKNCAFRVLCKKEHTVASDVDLLVVVDGKKCSVDEAYRTLMMNINLPRVELHMLSEKDYELMKNSRWIKTIEREGISIL